MKNDSPFPLWIIGVGLIGVAAFFSPGTPAGPLTEEQKGELIGQGLVVILGWIIGLALIMVSVIRAIRSRRERNHR